MGIDTRRVTIASATPHRASDPLRLEVRLTAASTVRLEIFDVAGRRLAIVSSGRLDPGTHDLVWRPGTRDAGARFLRVSTDRWTETRMVQLLP